jgi:hypothetical protein
VDSLTVLVTAPTRRPRSWTRETVSEPSSPVSPSRRPSLALFFSRPSTDVAAVSPSTSPAGSKRPSYFSTKIVSPVEIKSYLRALNAKIDDPLFGDG